MKEKDVQKEIELDEMQFINSMDKVINHKWYSKVIIVINKECQFIVEVLIDSRTYLDCICEEI
ncbi:hypothetical protein ACMBCN_01950, partial [Candidatus Liberibacter asiaticus]|nr:hypothetical protein [Candidatus Liberibacter asiaticus]